jgi:thiamine kinase-like enzyme
MTDQGVHGELAADLIRALGRVPELSGRRLSLARLPGGTTNHNLLVEASGLGERFVVRLAGNDALLLGIGRGVEHAATVMAAGVGVGPLVVAFIRPEGYLLTRFVAGEPVGADAAHRPETIRRVADSIRRVHDGPAIPGIFTPFRMVEAYRALAQERGVPIPDAYGPADAAARRIELALLSNPVEIRPSHNDLLSGNLIDDGRRIRIVDWGYAGMGDPFFDLGSFSARHGLGDDEDALLLGAYEGEVRLDRLARLGLMRVASDFREAMWAVLQQAISTLDVDFAAYAAEHFDRLLDEASRPTFERRLRLASGG